jgi:hypothetical protein
MLAVSAGLSLLLLTAGSGWAGGRAKATAESSKDKEPASFNKTFQWEERVVGPKDKGVDHDKIAAMQEQGRREDAAKRREPPKRPTRTEGVNGPASSVIPTQDIEKPHAVTVRKASYTPPPKQHDEIDNVLAENGAGSGDEGGRDGLSKVFGGSSSSGGGHAVVARSSSRPHKVAAKHTKHGRRRR